MTQIIYKTRVVLINIGKIIPFVLCLVTCISYFEDIVALAFNNIVRCGDYCVLNKPISWFLGTYFEYNTQSLVIITIISIAIETCYWNKLAILYLFIQLYEKDYFMTIEISNCMLYTIIIANMLISAFFTTKGVIISVKSKHLWKK